jgi:hypothetical protein
MATRIIIILLVGLLIASCATAKKPVMAGEKEQEILYIYPDGVMEFKGRIMNEEDVVVYRDGNRGERAGVKLMIPLHPDAYRDNITVERKEIDVPVVRKK